MGKSKLKNTQKNTIPVKDLQLERRLVRDLKILKQFQRVCVFQYLMQIEFLIL